MPNADRFPDGCPAPASTNTPRCHVGQEVGEAVTPERRASEGARGRPAGGFENVASNTRSSTAARQREPRSPEAADSWRARRNCFL